MSRKMETPGKSGKKSKKEKSSKKKSGKKEKKRALEDDEAVVTTPVASVKDEGSTSKKGKGERTVHAPRFFPLSAIASPLASDEEAKKLFVLVGKAIKANKVRRGVKEGTKFLRKGEKGIMIFAGRSVFGRVVFVILKEFFYPFFQGMLNRWM